MPARTIIYIDGFNFYYGAIRGGAHKWLDSEGVFKRLRPHDDIVTIHYFTALVSGRKQANPEAYLRALSTCPKVNIILGKFKRKQVKCRVKSCQHDGERVFDSAEEKRTDVNIALQMLDDAMCDRADRMILVSGDSDLVPALELVKARRPVVELVVYVPSRNPARRAATELRMAADKHRTFPLRLLAVSSFPVELADGRGGSIRKPAGW